jgi:hypothetical protein
MRRGTILLVALVALTLAGCSVARQLTTKRIGFTENLIPSRNHGDTYSTGTTDTGGPIGALPFDIQITGDVRTKYDKYNGGVDYAYLTYNAFNSGSAPVRIRLWATLAGNLNQCPAITQDDQGVPQVPEEAKVILDVTLPPKGSVNNFSDPSHNTEELRQIVEALLQRPDRAAACVYTQAESADPNGNVTISQLNVVGRAHGSLF